MDRYLLTGAVLAMEAAWLGGVVAVWGRWLAPGETRPLLPLWVVLATLAGGAAAGQRLLRRADAEPADGAWRSPVLVLALGLAWSLAVLWLGRHVGDGSAWIGALPDAAGRVLEGPTPDLAALLTLVVLWWRGLRLGAHPPDYAAAVQSFGLGSLLLSAALVASAAGLGQAPTLLVVGPIFLAGGLTALSLGRLIEAQRELEAGSSRGKLDVLGVSWLRSAGLPIAVVVVLGFAAALLIGSDYWRSILMGAIEAAGEALWAVLYWPLIGLGYVAEWLVYLLRALPKRAAEPEQPRNPPDVNRLIEELSRGGQGIPDTWNTALRWTAIALLAVGLLAAFLLTSRVAQRRPAHGDHAGEERESLWSWRAAWLAMRLWARRFLARWRARGVALAEAVSPGARAAREEAQGVGDARAAYRRMLALGREHGLPRQEAQTPREYHAAWREALPGGPEVEELTETYERARYGNPARPAPPAEPLRAALTRLRERLSVSSTINEDKAARALGR